MAKAPPRKRAATAPTDEWWKATRERLLAQAKEAAKRPGAPAQITAEEVRHARESIARADAFLARTAHRFRPAPRPPAVRRRGDRRLACGRPAARRTSRATRAGPDDDFGEEAEPPDGGPLVYIAGLAVEPGLLREPVARQ
jgi:hypothetical protein